MQTKNKIFLAISIIAVLIGSYYLGLSKGKQAIKEQPVEVGPAIRESEPNEIFIRKGTIKEIKEKKYIIETEAREILTIIIDDKTMFAIYHPEAQKFNLPTRLDELKVGNTIEATAKENIKGKTEFIAEMIKYTIDNQGGVWPTAALPSSSPAPTTTPIQ